MAALFSHVKPQNHEHLLQCDEAKKRDRERKTEEEEERKKRRHHVDILKSIYPDL